MNRRELVTTVAKKMNLPMNQVEAVLVSTLDTIKTNVKKGDNVTLVGFGTFMKAKKAARAGVNPSTGEAIKIKAKTVPKFRPGKDFREFVGKGR